MSNENKRFHFAVLVGVTAAFVENVATKTVNPRRSGEKKKWYAADSRICPALVPHVPT